eukprot:TRINITY_DN912_c0_g1_i1.p1 TRINITY_DN912_c0_g1~~TRINITY_DN912_c0_g1_i1.p1  ORF type:complete len:198 (-),score=41.60 TRINITY_DN912_c0_g1_i1:47-640(-)
MSSWFGFGWFTDVLKYLGFLNTEAKMALVGLDNAGKSTMMNMLANGRLGSFKPSERANNETVRIGKVDFNTFDLGGQAALRKGWKNYFVDIDVIVFVVDSADHARFQEAKIELEKLLVDKSLSQVPVLVLGNKVDLVDAASEEELRHHLGLIYTTGKQTEASQLEGHRPVELFMCSIARQAGYADGFRWVQKYVKGK